MITGEATPRERRRSAVHRARIDAIIREFLDDNGIAADDFISAQLTNRILTYIATHERRGTHRVAHGPGTGLST